MLADNVFENIKTDIKLRTNNTPLHNYFYRINGVEDKTTYENELFTFYHELKKSNRDVIIINNEIPKPTPSEISSVQRANYPNITRTISCLSANIKYPSNIELQRMMYRSFIDIMLEESKKNAENVNKLTNEAVYLLCWLKRYASNLFAKYNKGTTACFIYLGGCKNNREALFVRFLSRLPVDILILCPNLESKCCLQDSLLEEINNNESLQLSKFPEENVQTKIGTVAYHAERELDTLIYQDTGIYRNRQYAKANSIVLQTMYEEIKILWNQELKYRPNFNIIDNVVNVPVIFAKVSGIKDNDIDRYWVSIKELITPETLVIKSVPYISSTSENVMKAYSAEFYKNGKIQRNKIKSHPKYSYDILRDDIQELILDKLQSLIDQKLIKGIGQNGTEYNVIAQVLNLPKEIIRLIQNFDFTKKNPKLIYINTSENIISIEDSILITFLNLIGFDIIFFVPTGFQSIEKYLNTNVMEDHQIGEYKYDLHVPNFDMLALHNNKPFSTIKKFFNFS